MSFMTESWSARLAQSLQNSAGVYPPFLDDYWQANSYPARLTFNGRDETPYPKDDLRQLFDQARLAKRSDERVYFKPLLNAANPVRGVLRSHPAVGRALGTIAGNDEFQIRILNGASLTWLSVLISGLMERASIRRNGGFESAASELGALLDLSITTSDVDVPNDLDLGYDLLLFHGPVGKSEIDLSDGLLLKPATKLIDYLDTDWLGSSVSLVQKA